MLAQNRRDCSLIRGGNISFLTNKEMKNSKPRKINFLQVTSNEWFASINVLICQPYMKNGCSTHKLQQHYHRWLLLATPTIHNDPVMCKFMMTLQLSVSSSFLSTHGFLFNTKVIWKKYFPMNVQGILLHNSIPILPLTLGNCHYLKEVCLFFSFPHSPLLVLKQSSLFFPFAFLFSAFYQFFQLHIILIYVYYPYFLFASDHMIIFAGCVKCLMTFA